MPNELAPVLFAITAITGTILAVRSFRRFPRTFLSSLIYIAYAAVFGLFPLFYYWAPTSSSGTAAIAALLGLIGLRLGQALVAPRLDWRDREDITLESLTPNRLSLLAGLSAIVGAIGFLMMAYGSAGSVLSFVTGARFEYRSAQFPLLDLLGSSLFRFLSLPAILLSAQASRYKANLGLALALLFATASFVVTQGARAYPVGLIATAMLVRFSLRTSVRTRNAPGNRGRPLAGAVATVLVIGIVLPLAYQARKTLHEQGLTSSVGAAVQSFRTTSSGSGVLESEPFNYSQLLLAATQSFPNRHGYLWLYPLRRTLFFPLPSGSLKPDDTNIVFAKAIGRGNGIDTTIPPSLPGEGFVAAGGLLGVLPWTAMYGAIVGMVERRVRRPAVLLSLLVVGAELGLLCMRGQFYEIAVRGGTIFAVSLVLLKLIEIAPRRTSPLPADALPQGER